MNRFRAVCFALLFFTASAHSAAPVTHVYFAERWMAAHAIADQGAQKAFIAGTLFPDIRYLGTISRSKTHEKGVTARKIKNTANPFIAGKRLHAFVDVKREKFVRESKIFSRLKMITKAKRVLFLKLLEDEILWDRTNCTLSQRALEKIYAEEIAAGVDDATAKEWHQTMSDYVAQRPSDFLKALAKAQKGFLQANKANVAEWSRLLPLFAADPMFIEYMDQLLSHFEKLFAQ